MKWGESDGLKKLNRSENIGKLYDEKMNEKNSIIIEILNSVLYSRYFISFALWLTR